MHPTKFYSRQLKLNEIGEKGQEKLQNTSLVIIGAGGLGHPAAQYLSAAGVGKITIIDDDKIEESNLNRQILFNETDLGQSKSITLQKRLSVQNPLIEVNAIHGRLDRSNILELVSDADILLDCTDNFETKFLLHDFAYDKDINLIQASIHQYEGQIRTFHYASKDKENGCLRCLWEKIPHQSCVENCQEAGVLGATAGVLGTLQAMEALKLILNLSKPDQKRSTFFFNLLTMDSFSLTWDKNENCPLCSQNLLHWKDQTSPLEVYTFPEGYLVIDLTKNKISHQNTEEWKNFINPEQNYVFVCQKGLRSYQLVTELHAKELTNCLSLKGGWDRLNRHA